MVSRVNSPSIILGAEVEAEESVLVRMKRIHRRNRLEKAWEEG